MKRYFILVIVIFLFVGILDVKAEKPLRGKVIVIDPGHGGLDPGTVYQNVYEKDINLRISLYLKDYLKEYGAEVILTRDGDYDLSYPNAIYRKKSDFDNRIKIINEYADYYLSIHLNYLNDIDYYGIQVFSSNEELDNGIIMQKHLNSKLNNNRNNKIIPSNVYMYKRLTKPGLLIECGFMSNQKERNLLIMHEYQKKVAKYIAKGMLRINI